MHTSADADSCISSNALVQVLSIIHQDLRSDPVRSDASYLGPTGSLRKVYQVQPTARQAGRASRGFTNQHIHTDAYIHTYIHTYLPTYITPQLHQLKGAGVRTSYKKCSRFLEIPNHPIIPPL